MWPLHFTGCSSSKTSPSYDTKHINIKNQSTLRHQTLLPQDQEPINPITPNTVTSTSRASQPCDNKCCYININNQSTPNVVSSTSITILPCDIKHCYTKIKNHSTLWHQTHQHQQPIMYNTKHFYINIKNQWTLLHQTLQHQHQELVVVAFSSRVRILGECLVIHSLPPFFFF